MTDKEPAISLSRALGILASKRTQYIRAYTGKDGFQEAARTGLRLLDDVAEAMKAEAERMR